MGDYARIERRVWNSPTFKKLSEDAQRLWFYLLTCPHGKILGLFVLKPGYALADLNNSTSKPWTRQRFDKGLRELLAVPLTGDQGNGLVLHDPETDLILVKHYLYPEYNALQNPNQVKAALDFLEELPVSPLFLEIAAILERLGQPFTEPLRERLRERYGKPVAVSCDCDCGCDCDCETEVVPPQAEPPAPSPELPAAFVEVLDKAGCLGHPKVRPKDSFFFSLLETYSLADLCREIVRCNTWLLGHQDKRPKTEKGCRARISNWLVKAESLGHLGGGNGRDKSKQIERRDSGPRESDKYQNLPETVIGDDDPGDCKPDST